MVDVTSLEISVTEAAERLGITTEQAYDLVFNRRLQTVESPTGRRVVPLNALEDFMAQRESADEPV